MHVYVLEHIAFPTEQILWMLTKLGSGEVIMALYMCLRLFGQIRPEVDPGRCKNRSMRGPFSKRLLQIGMQQQQTEHDHECPFISQCK